MREIVLIGTKHSEDGLINTNELLKIFEKINPDIVFEEIPPLFYDLYYKTKVKFNLESQTIIKYLEKNKIRHIPVDYYDVSKTFFNDTRKVYEFVEQRSYTFCNLTDQNKILAARKGFKYLNSEEYERIEFAINSEITKVIKLLKDNKYSEYWNTWLNIEQIREHKMLENIYEYSLANQYESGIFLIGAGHRKSIINKIENHDSIKNDFIKWTYNKYYGLWD